MPELSLKSYSPLGLLGIYNDLMEELRHREILRSSNNPVSDYAELLACEALGLRRAPQSEKGFDADDAAGKRYEVKARRYAAHSTPRHFSTIRGLSDHNFDYLIAVLFEANFEVQSAWSIPVSVVEEIGTYVEHVNGWRVTIGACRSRLEDGVDHTESFRETQKISDSIQEEE